MSDRSTPDASEKPEPAPHSRGSEQPEEEQPEREQPKGEPRTEKKSTVLPLKSAQSLERLRERVEEAAQELTRLREENQALAARIAEFEARPVGEPGDTLVSFEEDPEALRRKVTGFIEAIDQYLAQEG